MQASTREGLNEHLCGMYSENRRDVIICDAKTVAKAMDKSDGSQVDETDYVEARCGETWA